MQEKKERKTKILIIGNGFGGTYTLKALHKYFHKNNNIELSLIGEKNYFLFTPLLHEVATGGINPQNIIESIRKVLKCCLKNFYLGKVELINLKDKTVNIGNITVSYDYLVLAPGAETNFFNIPDASTYCFTLKSIDDALKIKNHLITQIERASNIKDAEERKKILSFVVVGGGPTGVELTAELQEFIQGSFSHYYPKELIKETSVTLIQGAKELMPQFSKKMREKSLQVLRKEKVKVMLGVAVKEVSNSGITLKNETKISTETIIWTAGIRPAQIEFTEIVNKLHDGRLIANEYLQLQEHNEVFVLGDIAAVKDVVSGAYLPALAQVAEREAKIVAENIFLSIKNSPLKKFSYKSSGSLVSLGQWMAIGEISNFTFWGHIAWWIWRTVYLSKLISWRKKVKVAVDWTINIFSSRDISQI